VVAIITLTTDFGLKDPYVGIMKGVILGINPEARLVDLTHEIAPQEILEGALALEAAVPFFPPGSIHLAVVDPGVGSSRRPLALAARGQSFVGPDNGLFSFLFAEPGWAAVTLEAPAFRLPAVSRTFHGRDLFAPAAAHLSLGLPLERLGPPLNDPVRLTWPEPRWEGGALVGEVLHVDRFGNLVTSLRGTALAELGPEEGWAVEIEGRSLGPPVRSFSEGPSGASAAILGSSGRLEIFVRRGSARALLGAERGALVRVRKR
jgi:S-adenosylmethionine hydrolase